MGFALGDVFFWGVTDVVRDDSFLCFVGARPWFLLVGLPSKG